MKLSPVTIVVLAFFAALWLNSGNDSMPVAAENPVAEFDYGDDPPPLGAAVGATPPVIDSVAAAEKADVSAFSDVPPEPADVPKPMAATPVASMPPGVSSSPDNTDWVQNVVPVHSGNSSGCAVAVAPDTLLSVYHVVKYNRAQVEILGTRVTTAVTHPPGVNDLEHDGAYLKVTNTGLPSMRVRAPVYYEPVTVYGLATKTKQRGFVSNYRIVSLLPEMPGIRSGDSGGAVVADDGCLVGLISGIPVGFDKIPTNPRLVAFTRIDYLSPYLPKQGMEGTNPDVPKPVGDVFPDQPSAFDPAPVNKNQTTATVPYKYQYWYEYRGYSTPRRRLFR